MIQYLFLVLIDHHMLLETRHLHFLFEEIFLVALIQVQSVMLVCYLVLILMMMMKMM